MKTVLSLKTDFISIDPPKITNSNKDDSNPFGFAIYEEANVREIVRNKGDTDLIFVANIIRHVVRKEYPIHSDLLNKRLACIFGNQKATSVVRGSVNIVIKKELLNELEIREGF